MANATLTKEQAYEEAYRLYPQPVKRPLSTQATRNRKKRALKALRQTLSVTDACKAAGIGRKTHYLWMETDPDYVAAVEEIDQMKADAMEQAAFQRGVLGVDKLIFHQGEVCGKQREYSDALLTLSLKAYRPEKYRDQLQLDANVNHTLVPVSAIDHVMARAHELRSAGAIEASVEAPEQESTGEAIQDDETTRE